MFELYSVPSEEVFFPIKYIGHFDSPAAAMHRLGISAGDMGRLLDGKIAGGYILEFDSHFMRDLAIDAVVQKHVDHLNCREIAQELCMNEDAVNKHLNNAVRKLKSQGVAHDLAEAIIA